MSIRVLLFASYADALGTSEMPMEIGSGSLVRDVLRRVLELPGTGSLPPRPLMAVNAEYATLDRVVADGDEVAIIPPVAGG
ncbi:MAG: MoaD/ThiS family protein [Gemmatimonadaceae bacterium]